MLDNNRRGTALVLTLWILAALVVLAAGLGMMARTEAQISRNFGNLVRCRWAARAGENRALVEIESLVTEPRTYLGEQGLALSSEEEEIDLSDESYEVVVEDEAGKLNINSAPRSALEALFDSREIADCIIDWRDKDDTPRPLGAESQYYSSLRTPYSSKNGPFDTVGELLLVKDITKETLSIPATADGRPLSDLLTVYSWDKNVTVDGKERVNIQTAAKEQLKAAFGEVLTDPDIDAIIKHRGTQEFKAAAEIALVPELPRDKVRRIYDRITVSDKKTLPGRVNINTAPIEVLSVLPGMDTSMAESIVTRRSSEGAFDNVSDLMAVSGITSEVFAKCADLLTVRSRVFKVISTGRLARERSSRVVTCVVDVTEGASARIKYWQE